jgi:hypothetical protein
MFLGAVIISAAQESKTDKNFQKKKFNTEVITDTTEHFVISPKIKTDTSAINIMPFQKLPGDSFSQNNQSIYDFFSNHQKSELRMPVASGGYYFNMPISVPDSAVQHYIKEKRINYVNPLGKNFK